MKSTGIIRKVDELGRIVIPMELRKSMDIKEKDPLEIFTDQGSIVLKKYSNTCVFCRISTVENRGIIVREAITFATQNDSVVSQV